MKIKILYFYFILLPLAFADLKVGFYASSCPKAESIVKKVVQNRFNRDKSITAALLRMHFHDCAVRVRYNLILAHTYRYFSFSNRLFIIRPNVRVRN